MSAAETIRSLLVELGEVGCRIWVEDGKLKVRTSAAGLSSVLKLQLQANKTQLLTYLTEMTSEALSLPQLTSTNSPPQLPKLKPSSREDTFELSYGQRAFWFLYCNEPASAAYNVAMPWRLSSTINVPALKSALQALLERHACLRSTFSEQDGQAVQLIHPCQDLYFEQLDASEDTEEALYQRVRAAYIRPFDLEQGPLLRAHLFTQATDKHVLLLTVHHIVFDGWSLWNLMSELLCVYSSIVEKNTPELAALSWCYQDYVSWQNELFSSREGERLWSYWQKQLAEPPPPLDLPTDWPRSPMQANNGASIRFSLSQELTEQLKAYVLSSGTTLYVTLLACFQVLLYRYTGQRDIWVGSAAAGRSLAEFKDICGCFFNFIVLRGKLDETQSFSTFLTQMQQTTLDALAHQDYPSLLLIERLALQRESNRFALFQVEFNLQQPQQGHVLSPAYSANGSNKSCAISHGGLLLQPYDLPQQEGQFDLSLDVLDVAGQSLSGTFRYNAALFDASRIQRMLGHFESLLKTAISESQTPIAQLPLLTEGEQLQVLALWSNKEEAPTKDTQPPFLCIHTLFEQQVATNPNATAVTFKNETISYGELNERANGIAHQLRSLGVGPDVLVGLFVERSMDIVVGILAILKAGGAYVPLDPEYPADRLSFMAMDAKLKVLLCHEATVERIPQCTAQLLNMSSEVFHAENSSNPEQLVGPSNLAYVIYTSGSTGTPKGVCVEHRNVVRLFKATEQTYQFGSSDVWTLFHSHAFDFSVWEIWGALIHGGSLVIVPYTTARTPKLFYELLINSGVTVLNQTPSAFCQLIEFEETLRSDVNGELSLRWVIFGGEALNPARLKPWYMRHGEQGPTLVNMYGITETTVHVTAKVLKPRDVEGASSNIGVPISDLYVYILDEYYQPLPIGIPGELYVGGAGVARGYLNRVELTEARFINDPVNKQSKEFVYRTGDLCRWMPDGSIEYLGRVDTQVKVRGFRIECTEVEDALLSHCKIIGVVVDAWGEEEQKQLVAWVRLEEDAVESQALAEDLRAYLCGVLPNWMIPSRCVFVDKFPLTPSGKTDRRALTVSKLDIADENRKYTAPENTTEAKLCRIFADLLGASRVGVHDNFFELGGHSLLSMRLLSAVRKEIQVDVPLGVLFQYPTVRDLAKAIRTREGWPKSLLVQLQLGDSKPPLFVIHPVGGGVLCYNELAQALGSNRSVYGIQAIGLEGKAEPLNDIQAMASRYIEEMIELYPSGPYHLYGWSMGGVIAFEIAQQLQAANREVGLIVLADTGLPSLSEQQQISKDEEVLLHLLAEAGELDRAFQQALRTTHKESRRALILERLAHSPSPLDPEDIAKLTPIYRANLSAVSTYQPNTTNNLIHFIRAHERLDGQEDSFVYWCELAKQVELHEVNGNHFTMHNRMGAEKIATLLEHYLNRN